MAFPGLQKLTYGLVQESVRSWLHVQLSHTVTQVLFLFCFHSHICCSNLLMAVEALYTLSSQHGHESVLGEGGWLLLGRGPTEEGSS